jgi:hypothetical protein
MHGVELPRRHLRDDARFELNVCNLPGRAPLGQNAPHVPTVKWMPAIVDHDILPDMGRMTPRLH